jgi:hypothetical protein
MNLGPLTYAQTHNVDAAGNGPERYESAHRGVEQGGAAAMERVGWEINEATSCRISLVILAFAFQVSFRHEA